MRFIPIEQVVEVSICLVRDHSKESPFEIYKRGASTADINNFGYHSVYSPRARYPQSPSFQ